MKQNPRIALVLDNPQRDLGGLTLLAAELCQRGATCYIVPASLRSREIWALAPDFVLLFHFRRGFDGLAAQLSEAGIPFGVLDNEGGIWPEIEHYTELLVPDATLRRRVAPMCTWGTRLGNHLVQHGFFSAEQVVVTGCPRFDFYHPSLRSVIAGAHGSAGGRRHILINTNYSEANPRFTPIAGVITHLCDVFGWTQERAEALIAMQGVALDATIEMARGLAGDFPDVQIVLRPHPFEGTDVYAHRLAGLPNVEMNLSGPVQAQIERAAVVIQRTSTTAIETSLAAVPALLPAWVPTVAPMPMVESVSIPCASYDEMRDTVNAILGNRYEQRETIRQAVEQVVHDWFFQIDGLAHRRVADAVMAQLGATSVNRTVCARLLHGLDGSPHAAPTLLGKLARYGAGLSPEWSFRHMRAVPEQAWTQTDQYYEAGEVGRVAARVVAAQRSGGRSVRDLRVQQARDGKHYMHGFAGHSVVLECA